MKHIFTFSTGVKPGGLRASTILWCVRKCHELSFSIVK